MKSRPQTATPAEGVYSYVNQEAHKKKPPHTYRNNDFIF